MRGNTRTTNHVSSEQAEGPAIRQAVAGEVCDIRGHDLHDAGFRREPVERSVGQIHFTLARLGIAPHPPDHGAEVMGRKRIDDRAAEFDPAQQLLALRRFEQEGGLDHTGRS